MLGPRDPLPFRPRRILVAGTAGSGKSTLAAALSRRPGMPYHELDALHHGPDRVPRPEFAADVAAFAATAVWVTEWQYRAVRPLLLARADLLVWLDLTRLQVARGLLPRTVLRRVRRVELWNGNVEPPLRTILTDPEHVVRWAWSTHARNAITVHEAAAAPDGPVVVRLCGRRDTRAWLAGAVTAAGS